jgi:hypothetical protein
MLEWLRAGWSFDRACRLIQERRLDEGRDALINTLRLLERTLESLLAPAVFSTALVAGLLLGWVELGRRQPGAARLALANAMGLWERLARHRGVAPDDALVDWRAKAEELRRAIEGVRGPAA